MGTISGLALCITVVAAREIVFPPVLNTQQLFGTYNSPFDQDISTPLFNGLSTYAGLPYVHCLAPAEHEVEKYDIAILGAPFDTVSGQSPSFVGQTGPVVAHAAF